MADIEKTIDIIFGGIDNTRFALDAIDTNITLLSTKLSDVTEPLDALGEKALATEAAILGLGTAFLGVAINEAGQFTTSMNEIGTLFDATPEQVKILADEVKAFGVSSVFSVEDTTTALYNLISATGDTENAVAGLTEAQSLGVVTNSSLSDSVNAITTVLAAYSLDMTHAGDASDDLFTIIQNGKTTLPELSANIGTIASTAAAADVPFQDLGAAIAAMTVTMGGRTPEAMTTLKALFVELANPSNELTAALNGMTLEGDGLQAVMLRLQEVTGGNLASMNGLFSSTEAARGAIVLSEDSIGTFNTALESMQDNLGRTSLNFDLMKENLDLAMQGLRTTLSFAMIEIGENLEQDWAGIITSLTGLFAGITVEISDGTFDPIFNALSDFSTAISAYIDGIAQVLPEALDRLDFSTLIASFGGLNTALGGMFEGIDLTTVNGLAEALQFVVDSSSSLTQFVTGIVTAWGPALDIVKDFVDSINSLDGDTIESAGVLTGISQVFETFQNILPIINTGFGVLKDLFLAIAAINAAIFFVTFAEGLGAIPLAGVNLALGSFINLLRFGVAGATLVASLAIGALIADGIDVLINKINGTEGQTLGTWLYDITHTDGTVTTETLESLGNAANALLTPVENAYNSVRDFLNGEGLTERSKEYIRNIDAAINDYSLDETTRIRTELEKIINADLGAEETETALRTIHDSLGNVAVETPPAEVAVRNFAQEVSNMVGAAAGAEGAFSDASLNIAEFGHASGRTTEQIDALINSIWGIGEPVHDTSVSLGRVLTATEAYGQTNELVVPTINHVEDALHNLSDKEQLVIENTHDMETTLEELASNERIAAMSFRAELDIENIRANARIMEAVFSSTADVISSLSEGVTSLYAIFAEESSGDRISATAQAILDAAQRQEDRLQNELDMRQRLIDAQIAYLDAQADAINQESIIRIESDGLSQHIEAFMFEILQQIQLRVAGDRNAFLLGAGI